MEDPVVRAPDMSVVICAYTADRWEQTCAAVDSVRKQSLPSAEIILVIDYNPGLYQRATRDLPGVTVLANQGAKGVSGARNTGAARSRGEIIVFLDDDAVAHEDWLKFLADSYETPGITGVGGLTLPRWQTAQPRWLPAEFFWVIGCNYAGLPASGAPVRNLIGANMSFRREAFELVEGGFAAEFGRTDGKRPISCEDTEFCIRLGRKAPGSLFVMDHRAIIWHFVPDIRCRFSYFLFRCFAEGISKARVTANVGPGAGLSAEYFHATRALPRGVARAVRDACRGDLAGFARAGAIFAGLGAATLGYAWARLLPARERIPSA